MKNFFILSGESLLETPKIIDFETLYDRYVKHLSFPHCDYVVFLEEKKLYLFVECTRYLERATNRERFVPKPVFIDETIRQKEIKEIVKKALGSLIVAGICKDETLGCVFAKGYKRIFVLMASIDKTYVRDGRLSPTALRVWDSMLKTISEYISPFYLPVDGRVVVFVPLIDDMSCETKIYEMIK